MTEKTFPEINIIGIETRASNSDMQSISNLWGRFYSEDIINKIPNKLGDEIISLYCDYEGDHTKPYTLVIGCKVISVENIPVGMVKKKIHAGKFAVFTAKGKIPGCIIETWQKIWTSGIKRTYIGDYEDYGAGSSNPEKEVNIYIAIE